VPCIVEFFPQTQDDTDAREHFRNHYRSTEYSRYDGTVTAVQQPDLVNFIYGHTDTLRLSDTNAVFYQLFTQGILYPSVTGDRLCFITNLKPLPVDCAFPHRRRFTFWHYIPGYLNPDVYLFELTNPHATAQTNLQSFFQGAELTFIELGWTVL
jgi:hypothetical protein